MTGGEPPIPSTTGWFLNVTRLRQDLYRLVSVLLANRVDWFYSGLSLEALREEFEQDALDHALVTIAIRARVLMDQGSPRAAVARESCGQLFRESAKAAPRTLTLREGCNKIIHAERRVFLEYEAEPELTGVVELHGTQVGHEWRAELNTLKFIRLVLELIANGGGVSPDGRAAERADATDNAG